MSKNVIKNTFKNILYGFCLCTCFSTSVLAGWQLEWIDDFDGTRVNKSNWTSQTQANYNAEVQCYTDDDTSVNKNYDVSNGSLKIVARKGGHSCDGLGGVSRSWTSGRINSKDKREFLYGRIEARIRFYDLKGGTWPAFWMLENRINEQPFKGDNDFVGWPNPGAGEIDVWEWYANGSGSYITNFFNTNNCGSETRYSYPGGASDVQQWHDYAIEWNQDFIKFFIDNNLVRSHDVSNCAQYKEPMFILLNVAMGGTLGGAIDPTLTTASMEVDFVAHCSLNTSNNVSQCNASTPSKTLPVITSNPSRSILSNSFYNYTLVATDADGDNLTFSAPVLPGWLTFNSVNGLLTGTPTTANAGSHSVTLAVNDGSNIINQSFTILVSVPAAPTPIPTVVNNNLPTISTSSNVKAQVGRSYQNQVIAADIDNDTLVLSAPVLPNWMLFNGATGLLSGTPSDADIGTHNVSLSVNDGRDTVTQSLIIAVVDAPLVTPSQVTNNSPKFTTNPLKVGSVGSTYNYPVIVNDEDGDDVEIIATTLPSWLSFNADTNLLTGVPEANDLGIHAVSLSVTDGTVNTIQEFDITVSNIQESTSTDTTDSEVSSSGGGITDVLFLILFLVLLGFRYHRRTLIKNAKKWGGVNYKFIKQPEHN